MKIDKVMQYRLDTKLKVLTGYSLLRKAQEQCLSISSTVEPLFNGHFGTSISVLNKEMSLM